MKHAEQTKIKKLARMLIWTIRYQDEIAYHLRLYMWSAVAFVLMLSLSQKISLEAALQVILFGGLTICCWLWLFIERRRAWLLSIKDPELKREAYIAMLAYLAVKEGKSDHHQLKSVDI